MAFCLFSLNHFFVAASSHLLSFVASPYHAATAVANRGYNLHWSLFRQQTGWKRSRIKKERTP
jgi:hypothetical protein